MFCRFDRRRLSKPLSTQPALSEFEGTSPTFADSTPRLQM